MTNLTHTVVRRIAIAAAAVAMLASATTATAQASTNIVGTAVNPSNGTRVAGAAVWLYRWNGSSWVNLGQKATTNSSGVVICHDRCDARPITTVPACAARDARSSGAG
jgi:opacity protein-like surface antigen